VRRKIVDHDDILALEGGGQTLFDVGQKLGSNRESWTRNSFELCRRRCRPLFGVTAWPRQKIERIF
jgi:hypothetical protein